MKVILITLDCVRADHVGGELTPGINALSEEWTVFNQAFSQSQNTLSSHLSMLTSNYLFQHGVYSNFVNKELPAHSLSGRLTEMGWQCRAFTSADFLCRLLGNKIGAADPRYEKRKKSWLSRFRNRGPESRASAGETSSQGLNWFDSIGGKNNGFLWLHFFDAHMVYEAPDEYLGRYVKKGTAGKSIREQLGSKGWFSPEFPEYDQKLTLEHFPGRYRAAVAYQDSVIDGFVKELKIRGEWDDTMLIITADHGECLLGDHDVYCAHKKLFDTTVHVPLLVRFPGGKHAGERVDAIVQHVDIAPTIAVVAGFSEPLYMGKNLEKIASGEDEGHPFAFAEHVENFMRAARDGSFIYTQIVPGAENRWSMKMEEGNLFNRDSVPVSSGGEEESARFKEYIDSLMTSRPEVAEAWGEERAADDATAARLRELGYM